VGAWVGGWPGGLMDENGCGGMDGWMWMGGCGCGWVDVDVDGCNYMPRLRECA